MRDDYIDPNDWVDENYPDDDIPNIYDDEAEYYEEWWSNDDPLDYT